MQQIIWVVGGSAVGKETCMRYVAQHPENEVVRRLAIEAPITMCQESLKNAVHVGDDRAVLRRGIINEAWRYKDAPGSFVIKWQYADTDMKIPQELHAAQRHVQHRVIVLNVRPDTIKHRLRSRSWWAGVADHDDSIAHEAALVEASVREFAAFTEIVHVRADGDYELAED